MIKKLFGLIVLLALILDLYYVITFMVGPIIGLKKTGGSSVLPEYQTADELY